mmetsp:Transcript_8153/g.18600  ORF Transcript_8153/g.18600 Transcript_8153/m.18600 type:complete len:347 (+) Transcript_8153:559-1599(+)
MVASRADVAELVTEVLRLHPGLKFLSDHTEFQEKYVVTVACRVMYSANSSRTGGLSRRECRQADLLGAWRDADAEDDINRVTRFFSYEHFYVLYCRYWELDTDHDGRLSREDLLKYGDHKLSRAIVDRIYEVGARPGPKQCPARAALPPPSLSASSPASSPAAWAAGAGQGGGRSLGWMGYEDFVYFMLSEEDKGNRASLAYWFECVDLDGDGAVSPNDMRPFYDVQCATMGSLGHDVVPFADLACQMSDMIHPEQPGRIRLTDLVRRDIVANAGVVFDALFNLDKFMSFEQRDPFAERHKREDPFCTDWDRFAFAEYNRLALEEEQREAEMDLDQSQGQGASFEA